MSDVAFTVRTCPPTFPYLPKPSNYGDTKSVTSVGDAVVHLMTYETIFGFQFDDLTGRCFRSGPALGLL